MSADSNVIKKELLIKELNVKWLKELSHYLTKSFTKGSQEEIEQTNGKFQDNIIHPEYIIFDFETDTHTYYP
jgi:hypothetical protein